ncbi:MAG: DUF3857 and transglutaminase domain-containing protein, partial [Acidobacteriales bacterium]|nr:DUF3857 and transglutaminase domain-containing protein [Terriglobales bacterium]
MKNRLSCNPVLRLPVTDRLLRLVALGLLTLVCSARLAAASDSAPAWMHAASTVPVPAHDEKIDAVLLYSEQNVTVVSADKIKTQVREVYKILRPEGRHHGTVQVYFRPPHSHVTSFHGWSIPAQGGDFAVKDKDAIDEAFSDGMTLVSDVRKKVLKIPAAEPGNIVGYEFEIEERPFLLQDEWEFQEESPVVEARYSLQLPPGWEFKVAWSNYSETRPTQSGPNQWQWLLKNVSGIRPEEEMPPLQGVAGRMILSFFPAGGPDTRNGFSDWRGMGNWYETLLEGRLDASPEIKQKVASLTASLSSPLQKMKVLANFVQHDVRYVAISLGIGGVQPHAASDVFTHHYGDCKDKATLLQSMLREIGIDSYYVVINAERGSVKADTPAHTGAFNHVIVAVKLPKDLSDSSLVATMDHPKLGKILFFDPTNDLTPFGRIGGYLQSNYGLLVAPGGGELVELPK